MNIYKQILVAFAILMVQFTCSPISENEEENKLESLDENFALDTNSTSESVVPDKYQTLNKRSLETKPSYQKESKNSKETSEPEYSEFAQRLKPTYSKWDLPAGEKQPNYEEKSDSVTTEEIGATSNIKHQSRSLKDFSKDSEFDSSNNKYENPLTNLDLGIGLKSWEKFTSEKNYLREVIKNSNLDERSILEQIFGILETNYGKEPVPGIPMGENGFRILIELGINPFNLDKPVSSQFIERLHNIYKEITTLIRVDIQSNIFPLVFYQTVSPIIKEKLLPRLEVPSLKQEIAIFDKDYKFPVLFTTLRDLIEIPEGLKGDDYTISNIFRMLDIDLKKRVINDIEGNEILAKLYKKNVERIQQLLDEDWKENDAPVNFIKYISDYFRKEKFYIIVSFINQMLNQKLKRNDQLQENVAESFQKFFESMEDEL